jgi:hypothetical protein
LRLQRYKLEALKYPSVKYWLKYHLAVTFVSKQGFWHYFSTISFLACTFLALGLSHGATKKPVYGWLAGGGFLRNYNNGGIHFLPKKKSFGCIVQALESLNKVVPF